MNWWLASIQNLPPVIWVAESDSIWGYAFMLFAHAVGMGLTAGVAFVISLRLLGVGHEIPVSSLRSLFRLFWGGFYLNLATGMVLFLTDATNMAYVPVLYVKLACLGAAIVTTSRLRHFINSSRSDGAVPLAVRTTAVACIVVWLSVIAAGRLIAYAVESNGAAAVTDARVHATG